MYVITAFEPPGIIISFKFRMLVVGIAFKIQLLVLLLLFCGLCILHVTSAMYYVITAFKPQTSFFFVFFQMLVVGIALKIQLLGLLLFSGYVQ